MKCLLMKVRKFVNKHSNLENIDLSVINYFAKLQSGLMTPPPINYTSLKIPMDNMSDFPAYIIMNIIVHNLFLQKIILSTCSWRNIFYFYFPRYEDGIFSSDRTEQIKLEALLIFSKLNADDAIFMGNANNQRLDRNRYYENNLNALLNKVCLAKDIKEKLTLADNTTEKKIKNFLILSSITSAIRTCINENFRLKIELAWVLDKIKTVKIYLIENFPPFKGLALMDGFLISRSMICQTTSEQADANLFSLCCHEFSHFLIRAHFNDYNVSSPLKAYIETAASASSSAPKKLFELGLAVETLLFDDVQPDWTESKITAAIAFIERAKQRDTCPPALIHKSEHDRLGLIARNRPSCSFAPNIGS